MEKKTRIEGKFLKVALLLIVCLALTMGSGCFLEGLFGGGKDKSAPAPAKKTQPVKKTTPAKKKAAAKPKEELTLEKLQEEYEKKSSAYTFDSAKLSDPFMPIAAIAAIPEIPEGGDELTPEEELTPLQKLELSQVRLVAVVIAGDMKRALVEDSAGMGYIIQVGTKMGKRGGKVTNIEPEIVEVLEYTKNFKGDRKEKTSTLKLHHNEGENK